MRNLRIVGCLLVLAALITYLTNQPAADVGEVKIQKIDEVAVPVMTRAKVDSTELAIPVPIRNKKKVTNTVSTANLLKQESRKILQAAKVDRAKLQVAPVDEKPQLPKKKFREEYIPQYQIGEKYRDDCNSEACQNIQKGYSVVGLVMTTSNERGRLNPKMNGQLEMGDAKRRPLLHIQ